MNTTATCSTWRGMGSVRLYFACDSPCDENKQPYRTGSVAARVNKDRAFLRTPEWRCQVCYWRFIEDSWKRHHHSRIEHKDTKSCRVTPGTNTRNGQIQNDGTSLNSVKRDGGTLAKQEQRKDTWFSSVENRINTSMALDFLFTRTS